MKGCYLEKWLKEFRPFFTLETTKGQYINGIRNPEAISPDNWNMDQLFLDRLGNEEIQLALVNKHGLPQMLF